MSQNNHSALVSMDQSWEEKRSADRRSQDIDFDRRCFDRRDGAFVFEKTVYLSDTNAFGNTYFAKYFEWQGMAREAFVKRCLVPNFQQMVSTGIKLITTEAHHTYKHETVVYDRVVIQLKVGPRKRSTVELLFKFSNKETGALIGHGRQVIAFANAKGKLIRVPEIIAQNIKPFMPKTKK
jgi:enediyne biosynthesis thioesterase